MHKITLIFLLIIQSTISLAQKTVKPWIGVQIEEGTGGVLIKKSFPNTPAARAGLTAGDIILQVDEVSVLVPAELISNVRKKGVGNEVSLKYYNSKKELKTTTLKLEAMPGLTKLMKENVLNKKAPSVVADILSKSNEKKFDLSKNKGKVVIIEFWATWCGACIQALPIIHSFAEKNKDKVIVLAISDEDPKKIKKYIKLAKSKKAISDSVIFLKGKDTKIKNDFYVPAFPSFVVIDKKNIVRDISVGVGAELLKTLKKSLLY